MARLRSCAAEHDMPELAQSMAIVQQLGVNFETRHVTAEITSFPWDCPGAVTHQALSGYSFKIIIG
jgi:hypothetical protein